jgi:hypothetical protein
MKIISPPRNQVPPELHLPSRWQTISDPQDYLFNEVPQMQSPVESPPRSTLQLTLENLKRREIIHISLLMGMFVLYSFLVLRANLA